MNEPVNEPDSQTVRPGQRASKIAKQEIYRYAHDETYVRIYVCMTNYQACCVSVRFDCMLTLLFLSFLYTLYVHEGEVREVEMGITLMRWVACVHTLRSWLLGEKKRLAGEKDIYGNC